MTTEPMTPAGGPPTALAIVPARLDSSRLPRKMMLRESGRYLFQHTIQNLLGCARIQRAVLATDSEEILRAAREVGVEALLTSTQHQSGTDRIHEALGQLTARGEGPWDVIVNVQGDEPEVPTKDLDRLVDSFGEQRVDLASMFVPTSDEAADRNPNVVKVVLDGRGDALYFSRSPLPSTERCDPLQTLPEQKRHVGVYAFRPRALTDFCHLPQGQLERIERLEQLRWLEDGRRIRMIEASRSPAGIDTREDYDSFVERQKNTTP